MYCQKCGAQVSGDFCPICGTKSNIQNFSDYTVHSAYQSGITPFEVAQKVRFHEKVSNIIWLVVGIVLCLLGLIQPSLLIAGVWDIVNAIIGLVNIKNIRPFNQAIINRYKNNLVNILIFIGINLVFGGMVGVLLCGYDLYIRYYVLKNKFAFYQV